jgi:hypothetical protein
MSSNLPILYSEDELPARQLGRAVRWQRSSQLSIYRHGLRAREAAERAILDSQAVGDVVKASLESELSLLDWGMSEAEGSPAKVELVARRIAQFSDFNTRRIDRFGR